MRSGALLMLAGYALLAGCGGSHGDMADLQHFVSEVKKRPAGVISPLPKFEPTEPFNYSASNLRSPFSPSGQVVIEDVEQQPRPDRYRVKGPLEQFGIDSFQMVGTMGNGSNTVALLARPDQVYSVHVGDYVGQNSGQITAINDQQVKVMELVPDGKGGWIKRPRIIKMKESI